MNESADRNLAGRIVDQFGGDYRRWLFGQFEPGGVRATALISVLMLAVSGAWVVAAGNPLEHHALLERLSRDFTLDATDWAGGRYWCHVSYALLWQGDWLNGILLFVGWLYFGSQAERRLGALRTAGLFAAAAFAGGWAYLAVQGPDAAWYEAAVRGWAARLPGPLADPGRAAADWVYAGWGRERYEYLMGPSAAVAAALAVALLLRDPESGWRDHPRHLVVAAVFLYLDLTGVLRVHSPVAYPPRAAGAAVALPLVLACGLSGLAAAAVRAARGRGRA